jgi:hypothetical protein
MNRLFAAALALLLAPAWAYAQSGKPAICQWQGPRNGNPASLTAQLNSRCVVTGTAGQRSIVTPPRNGTVSFSANGGDLRFTPSPGFVGSDEFVYAIGDVTRPGRRMVVVSVTVQREALAAPVVPPPSQAAAPAGWPVCSFHGATVGITSQAVETANGNMRVRAGARCGFNLNLQNVTVQTDASPIHGTLFVSGLSVTYTAPAGYSGGDSFVIRWSRGDQIRRIAVSVEVR